MSNSGSVLEQYAERVEDKLPVLGRLSWYSISDVKITEDDLTTLVGVVGLGAQYLPPSIQGQDAFRKATKAAERKYKFNGTTETFLLREVVCEDFMVQRNIVLEKVENGKLEYTTELGLVTYYRSDDVYPHGRVEVVNNAPYFDDRLVAIVNEMGAQIKEAFEDYSQYHHGNAIRAMVGRVLRACSTITVRSSGGVYFSPETYKADIGRLKLFFNRLNEYPGSRCEFHHLPLVDDKDQRAMLTAAFEDEAVTDVERTLDDIAKILKEGKSVTPNRYAQFVDSYKELKTKAREYSDILDEQMTRAGESLAILDEQIVALLDKVKD